MNKKKIITIGLALALTVGAVGCTKKSSVVTPEENTAMTEDYSSFYATGYNDYILGLDQYGMYSNPADITRVYENKEYPGNEQYVTDVKTAYTDSRDKIQGFLDTMKTQENIDDQEVKKMNDDLIAEGEKLVSELDTRIAKLDEIPAEAYDKTKEEFSQLVGEATTVAPEITNGFNSMIKEMNEFFGINTNK